MKSKKKCENCWEVVQSFLANSNFPNFTQGFIPGTPSTEVFSFPGQVCVTVRLTSCLSLPKERNFKEHEYDIFTGDRLLKSGLH